MEIYADAVNQTGREDVTIHAHLIPALFKLSIWFVIKKPHVKKTVIPLVSQGIGEMNVIKIDAWPQGVGRFVLEKEANIGHQTLHTEAMMVYSDGLI